ncbi:MAG: gamma-glutamyltransferase [Chloroflexi bacterium]|nr:gamma-glutamyltransferase [Chloroflexota bacterium]
MTSTSVWRIDKEEAVADRGMVAAKHPLAVQAGLAVLQRGGNAVDAAVTMAFALAVVEPGASGLGGGGLMVVHLAGSGRNVVVDFAMDAPLAATPDAYELAEEMSTGRFGWRKVRDDANIVGYRAAAVPGLVRGLALALERFGTIPLREALAPAIRYAEEGVPVTLPTYLRLAMNMPLLSRFPTSAAIFLPGGFPPRPEDALAPADRLVQPDLARTLRLIADDGPSAFYEGATARAIARAMQEQGGLIAEEDLARYRATIVEGGLVTDYRGHQIAGVPGASGCITAQQSLNILEGYDLASRGAGAPESLHLEAEAFRRAFADRRYVGDPKQVSVPWRGLTSREYAGVVRAGIDPTRAATAVEPGNPWAFDDATAPAVVDATAVQATGGGSSTTHLCAVDRERNAVTLTQTLADPVGCGAVVPGTGILLNNAMQWLNPEPDRPNSLAPGKRGLNNMTPLLVLRNGRPLLAIGASGGARIINAMAQIVVNVLDHGMSVQDAIAAPRIDCSGPAVLVDSRFPASVPAGLAAMGHRARVVEESFNAYHFSTPLGILIHPGTGRLHGGVDPFRLAVAAGY